MKILVLPGDGIGPEIVEAAMHVVTAALEKTGVAMQFDYAEAGFASLEKYGTTLRQELLEKAPTYHGIILGPISHADYPPPDAGGRNISAAFRTGLDLYANVRPARTRPFLPCNLKEGKTMDLVIMREATEGFYPDRNMARGWAELMPSSDMAVSFRKITRYCSERIARRAFELAMKRRRKVTAVHKVNAFHMTDGLFLEAVHDVAKQFPEVTLDDLLIDASTAHLVRNPERFDVIVTTNFYGDIISDLASELSGSIGLAGSIMAGDHRCCAQAQHGSAPDIAGQDRANPGSMILSIAMLMNWLGDYHQRSVFGEIGGRMEEAVDAVLADPQSRTADLGGPFGCAEFGRAVAAQVRN